MMCSRWGLPGIFHDCTVCQKNILKIQLVKKKVCKNKMGLSPSEVSFSKYKIFGPFGSIFYNNFFFVLQNKKYG